MPSVPKRFLLGSDAEHFPIVIDRVSAEVIEFETEDRAETVCAELNAERGLAFRDRASFQRRPLLPSDHIFPTGAQ